jgi:sarcosine oxidase subunit gamma
MTTANVYQQRPTTGARAESSLHHADLASLVGKGRKNAGVTVREKKLLGHLTIRGDGHDAAFAAGVHRPWAWSCPGPERDRQGETSLQWMGPDEWLLIVPAVKSCAEQKLREALGDLHIAIVNVSGGQQVLELSGPNVRRC